MCGKMRYKAVKRPEKRTPITVIEAYAEDGIRINPEKTYTLVLNSYLCSTVSPMPRDKGVSLQTDGAAALIEYLSRHGAIDYSEKTRVDLIPVN